MSHTTTTPATTTEVLPDLDLRQWYEQYAPPYTGPLVSQITGCAVGAVAFFLAYTVWHMRWLSLGAAIFATLGLYCAYKLQRIGDNLLVDQYENAREWLRRQLGNQGWKLDDVDSISRRTLRKIKLPADFVLKVTNPASKLQVLTVTVNDDYSITVHNTPHTEVGKSL